jgi:hypothetical protein
LTRARYHGASITRLEATSTTAKVIDAVVAEFNFGPEAANGMRNRVRVNMLNLIKVRGSVVKEAEREGATERLKTDV